MRRLAILLGSSIAAAACAGPSVSRQERTIATEVGVPGAERDGGPHPVSPEAPTPRGPESSQGYKVVRFAMKSQGAPYRWGGSNPSGFDCSGFVRYVYAQVGVWLPHNAAGQYSYGIPVSRESLRPGDVVFFDRLRHNGIYIGNGRFIHSRRTGKRVSISNLDEDWYRTRWVGGRRL